MKLYEGVPELSIKDAFMSAEAGRFVECSGEDRYSGVSSHERVLISKSLWKLEIACSKEYPWKSLRFQYKFSAYDFIYTF